LMKYRPEVRSGGCGGVIPWGA